MLDIVDVMFLHRLNLDPLKNPYVPKPKLEEKYVF